MHPDNTSLSLKTLTISSKKRMKIDFFEVVKKLHSLELFDDVLLFIEFNIKLHKLGDFYEEDEQAYIFYCQADSNFHLEHYSQCVKSYEKVKQLLNMIRKQKLVNRYSNILSLSEVNYRAHLALLQINSPKEALQCLESIPKQELQPKMLVALAKLQLSHHKRNVRTVVKDDSKIYANFKAVLDEVPEAIYCASYCAMSNSVSLSDSQKHYLLSGFSDQTKAWIQAKCSESSFKFIEAAAHLSKVSSDSYKFVLESARYYHIIGDHQTAMNFYQRAHAMDEAQCEGMDAYAALLAKLEENKLLEILANKLMQINPNSSEAFIAFGYLALVYDRIKDAQIFCQKACEISANKESRQHSQALFLKDQIQLRAKPTKSKTPIPGLFTPEMASSNHPTPVNRNPPPIGAPARQRPARHVHRRVSARLSSGVQTRRIRDDLEMIVQPRFDDDNEEEEMGSSPINFT